VRLHVRSDVTSEQGGKVEPNDIKRGPVVSSQ
jgi:hypothetical protein